MVSSLVAVAIAQSSAAPSRVLLNLTENAATSATVTWRFNQKPEQAIGQISVAESDPRFVTRATTVGGKLATAEWQTTNATYGEVRFTNLKPETLYTYRVGDGKTWSEWFQFKTASDKPKPFAFIYFGDAQNELKSQWSRVIRQSFQHLPRADFMLHAGDLVDVPNRDSDWEDWFYAGSFIHAMIPTVAVPGNHEYQRVEGSERTLSAFWRPQFSMPENGLPQLRRTNFVIEYQGARIIGLDSNRMIQEQAKWLDSLLSRDSKKWTIVTFHHPVYSTAQGRDNKAIREAWQPIFQKHKVALVLQGHDHTYGRFNVPTGLSRVDPKSGTTYVVSVSGPKMYRLDATKPPLPARKGEFVQLYQIIRVDGNRLRFEAYTVTGELYDAFELRKTAEGGQTLIDRKPRTPEKLDPPAKAKDDDGQR